MDFNTNSQVRNFNKRRILSFILEKRSVTKQQIARELNVSLPTVSSIVKELMEQNIITNGEVLGSTGGRKATTIVGVADYRFAIGVEVGSAHLRITMVNTKPEVVASKSYDCELDLTKEYWQQVNRHINAFVEEYVSDKEKILGVSIAVPFPVEDRKVVQMKSYPQEILVSEEELQAYYDFPIRLVSSSKLAAYAQIWILNRRENFQYINLGKYIAGAIVFREDVIEFDNRHAEYGNFLVPYKGEVRRVDEICSTEGIKRNTGLKLSEFFEQLEQGTEACVQFWKEYLDTLSICLYNMHCTLDWPIAIGGSLSPFLKPYMKEIQERISAISNFKDEARVDYVSISDFGEYSAATGAALSMQNEFLESI